MAKPEKIFIIRHGESEGNVSKEIYLKKPDYSLNLTENGKAQIKDVGCLLRSIIEYSWGLEPVWIYSSPFYRARQTTAILKDHLKVLKVIEDVRLREQEWNNNNLREDGEMRDSQEIRDRIGSFYYRFEGGENVADCWDRISGFLDTFWRDFEKVDFPRFVIISGHGMINRVLVARWLHYTVEEFETLRNPKNGQFYTLVQQKNGKYTLSEPPEKYPAPTRQY